MAIVVEGDPKAPFSIATTPSCRGGRYSFPRIYPFYPWPYLIMLSVKQGGIKYHFLSLWYDSTWDWIQVSRAIGEYCPPLHFGVIAIEKGHIYIYIYIYIIKISGKGNKPTLTTDPAILIFQSFLKKEHLRNRKNKILLNLLSVTHTHWCTKDFYLYFCGWGNCKFSIHVLFKSTSNFKSQLFPSKAQHNFVFT